MKKFISFILLLSLVLSLGIATAVFADEGIVYEKLFKSTNVNYTRNVNGYAGDLFASGLLATSKNNGKIVIGDKFSGEFVFDGRIISDKYGSSDFSRLDFTFQNLNNNQKFMLSLREDGSSVEMYAFIKEGDMFISDITDTTFDGRLSQITFGFDPESMEVYWGRGENRRVVIDLDDEKDLTALSLGTPFVDFKEYSVTIEFKQVKQNKEAKLLIYAISGQEFSNATWTDTKAPVIYDDIVANGGVVGKEYDTSKAIVPSFDLTDGYRTQFNGSVAVTDSDGNPVTVVEGKFTPTKIGAYLITYTPKDSAGNQGESAQVVVKMFANEQKLYFDYAFPVENQTLGAGDTVVLPYVKAVSALGDIPVSLTIKKDGELVTEIENVSKVYELFVESGIYTLTYFADDNAGTTLSESFTLSVIDIPYVKSSNINTEIGLGNLVDYSQTVAVHSSGYYPVTTVITAPNGESGTFTTFTPKTSGIHRVEFKYVYNSTEYKKVQFFDVSSKESDLWENIKGMTFESGVKSTEYSDFQYEGVKLTARMPNSEAIYKPLIDVTDNTIKAPIFEFIVAPIAVGSQELRYFSTILTDPETNDYIAITIHFSQWTDNHIARVYVTKNTTKTDGAVSKTLIANPKGTNDRGYPNQSVKYYYDYETNSIYAGYELNATTFCSKVASLSSLGFNGFSKGQAQLSVLYHELLSATANVLVINIDGKQTNNVYYEDQTGPQITVDFESNSESNLPKGAVNVVYPYFKASANDSIDGSLPVEVKVYYVDQNGQSSLYRTLTETGFKPTKVGRYDIVYSASDYSGNITNRVVSVNVEMSVPSINFDFGALVEEVKVGSTIIVPNGQATGGSGTLTVSKKVYFNGNEVAFDGKYFDVEVAGTYTVVATVVDYLKVPKEFTQNITVVATNEPVIKSVTMPNGILLNRPYVFPNLIAKDYSSGEGVQIPVKWFVDGIEVNGAYTPTSAGKINAKALAIGEAGQTELNYEIEVLTSGNVDSSKFTDGYFELENTTLEATMNGLTFSAINVNSTNSYSFKYLKPVKAQDMVAKYLVGDGANFDKIKFVLTDSINANISVAFSLDTMTGWNVLTYDPTTKSIKNGTILVTTFDKCVDGATEFEGFTSGYYFVKIELVGVNGDANVELANISSDSFTGKVNFAEQFFVANGFDVVCDSTSTKFIASGYSNYSEHIFTYFKPIIADGSYFRFKVDEESNDFTSYVITMTDSVNENIKISYEVSRGSSSSTTSKLNYNGVIKDCTGDWYSNTPAPFEFKYSQSGKYITDYQGNIVANLTNCVNGDKFEGFTSGYYYLSLEIKGLESDGFGTIALNSIMNQPFSSLVLKDVIKPNASFKSEFTFAKYGETLVIPALNAYDVLGEITNITLTVTAPDGSKVCNAITAFDGYSMQINQYGTYKIEYLVYDNASVIDPTVAPTRTRTSFTREFTVYDRIKPVITISGSIPKTVKVGDNIKLPTASVFDNNKIDITYKTYITGPDGEMKLVTDQAYKVEKEGRYTVVYYAIDDDGAFDMQRFTFNAVR